MATVRMRADGSYEIFDDGKEDITLDDGSRPMDVGQTYSGPDWQGGPSVINVASSMAPDEFYYAENEEQFDRWREGNPMSAAERGGGGGGGGGLADAADRIRQKEMFSERGAGPPEFFEDDLAPTRVDEEPGFRDRFPKELPVPNAGAGPMPDMPHRERMPMDMDPSAYMKGPRGTFEEDMQPPRSRPYDDSADMEPTRVPRGGDTYLPQVRGGGRERLETPPEDEMRARPGGLKYDPATGRFYFEGMESESEDTSLMMSNPYGISSGFRERNPQYANPRRGGRYVNAR